MKLSAPLVLSLVLCAGCQTHRIAPTKAQLQEKLSTIQLADGVSQAEAQIIGECYFARNVGCGIFSGVHDGGDRWIVDAAFGYAGQPVKGFYIEKHSGRIESPIGPSYESPFEIFP